MMRVLAIETSCDDTSVAVVLTDGTVEFLRSASQDEAHRPFGGVVPEIAGRNHTETLLPLVQKALAATGDWENIDGLAVTNRPGLLGSLLVGVVTAKTLALVKQKPFIGVNHLEGHVWAPFLKDKDYASKFDSHSPFISLAVSGGHTSMYQVDGLGSYKLLGATRDDAAGEAFDKFAKMLGLPFPGGVEVDKLSAGGDSKAYKFPKGMMEADSLEFSFSGLKTFAQNKVVALGQDVKRERIHDLCASFQAAVAETLVEKLNRAVIKTGIKRVTITGGVSANSGLRATAEKWAETYGIELQFPPLRYCTDNAAMIGFVGAMRMLRGERDNQRLAPDPGATLGDNLGAES